MHIDQSFDINMFKWRLTKLWAFDIFLIVNYKVDPDGIDRILKLSSIDDACTQCVCVCVCAICQDFKIFMHYLLFKYIITGRIDN